MAKRMFFVANFLVALMLFITTISLTTYGPAVNLSMSYLFSVIGVKIGQVLMWRRNPHLKEKTRPKGHLLTISGIVLTFFISFLVLYFSGESLKSFVGRIIVLSVSFINGLYLFLHIYFYNKTNLQE